MTIAGVHKASVFDGANANTYSTGSWTPTANRYAIATVINARSGTPTTPSLSGNGLTWSPAVNYQPDTTDPQFLITVFVAKTGGSPSAGAVTATFSGVSQIGCSIVVDELDSVDVSGTDLAAVVQSKTGTVNGSGTSESIALDNAIASGNASYGAFHIQLAVTVTPGNGHSVLGSGSHTGPVSDLATIFKGAGSQTVDVSWTGSAAKGGIALEIKAASTDVNLSGVGNIASAEAFGTPAISLAAAPSGIGSSEAIGTISIQASVEGVGAVASAEAFGAPIVSAAIAPASISSAEGVGSPALSLDVTPSGMGSAEAWGAPTVSTSSDVNLSDAGGITSIEAFGTPIISLALIPSGIATSEAIGAAKIEAGLVGLGDIASAEAFGTPVISMAIAPSGIISSEAFGAATLGVNVAGAGDIASGEGFGTLNVSGASPVDLTSVGNIASAEAFGDPGVVAVLSPAGIASNELFGAPTFVVHVFPSGITSAEAFGLPSVVDPAAITRIIHVNSRVTEAVSISSIAVDQISIDAEDVP